MTAKKKVQDDEESVVHLKHHMRMARAWLRKQGLRPDEKRVLSLAKLLEKEWSDGSADGWEQGIDHW